MKVIFLDVDGVLNCQASNSKCGGYIGIDGDKVKRLRCIAEKSNAKIVLISSWKTRWERTEKELQSELTNYLDRKLKRENLFILDKTKDQIWNRGEGIIQWCERSGRVDNFVILDDEEFDYEELNIKNRLIKTSFYEENGGLQDKHVELAIKLLTERKGENYDQICQR